MNFRQTMAVSIQRAVAARMVELGINAIPMEVVADIVDMACRDAEHCTIDVDAYVRRVLVIKNGELWLNA